MSKKLENLEISDGQLAEDEVQADLEKQEKSELLEVLAKHEDELEKDEDKKDKPKKLNQFDQSLADIFKNRPKQK